MIFILLWNEMLTRGRDSEKPQYNAHHPYGMWRTGKAVHWNKQNYTWNALNKADTCAWLPDSILPIFSNLSYSPGIKNVLFFCFCKSCSIHYISIEIIRRPFDIFTFIFCRIVVLVWVISWIVMAVFVEYSKIYCSSILLWR